MSNIAVFASGSGTNAQNLIRYFNSPRETENGQAENRSGARVEIVICNKPDAYVLERARKAGVKSYVLTKEELCGDRISELTEILRRHRIEYIVLAGYLLKIPQAIIDMYPDRILNIHPALLPAYGGKGMYGMHVHRAVIGAGEKRSGITVHLVDPAYDHGKILFQAECEIAPGDTPEKLAAKIHELEQANFPGVVDEYLTKSAASAENLFPR